MKKRSIIILIIIIMTLAAGTAAAVLVFRSMADKLAAYLEAVSIETVDLSRVPDGTWHGAADAAVVKAEAAVTVSGHVITEIRILRHIHGQGKAGEKVVDRIIAGQNTAADAISGATYSSLVIMDAVQKALKGAIP